MEAASDSREELLPQQQQQQQQQQQEDLALMARVREQYKFDACGRLVDAAGAPFTSGPMPLYERLCRLCYEHARSVAVDNFGFRELPPTPLPAAATPPAPQSSLADRIARARPVGAFISADFTTNRERALLIIKGAGDRTLCWSEPLCVRESFFAGSMLTYLEQAVAHGYAVAVASPNLQCGGVDIREQLFMAHMHELLFDVLPRCPAAYVDVVCFSYGGVVLTTMLREAWPTLLERLRRCVFIDSAHSLERHVLGPLAGADAQAHARFCRCFLRCNCVHYRASPLALGDYVPDGPERSGCDCYSAGSADHDTTPSAALQAVFDFLQRDLDVVDPETAALIESLSLD
eukprot:TRINITY_DN3003_c1_g2_i1.p1 TRINITY_DN3003_c1_g2~~TRINITY_DN3003_c1_g2_i1.p1  ORF type:complete len:347 (+),score=114.67 TRINITY_DN3003_c1_g2_i1:78-1118(+)